MVWEEWLFWAVTETIKYLLITYGVLGFCIRKGKRKYLVGLYLLVGIPLLAYLEIDTLLFRTLWGFFIIAVCFKGRIEKKIQCFILEYILITMTDLFFWSIFINSVSGNLKNDLEFITRTSGCLGALFWVFAVVALRKKRDNIYQYFLQLSKGYFCALLFILLGLAIMVGSIQFSLLEEKIPEILRRFSLLTGLVVTFVVIIGCIAFIYTVYSKKNTEMERKIERIRFESQQKYYEDVLEKDEGMRRFRHDIRKHMLVIKTLCEEKKMNEVKKYVDELYDDFERCEVIYTGNIVSDCFISAAIENLRNEDNFEYRIMGKFPEKLRISNNDFCILLANALENAQNAIKKVDGEKRLMVEIKNYREQVYIIIANSALPEEILNLNQGKRREHGYGTINMKQVVEKYGGEINFSFAEGIFTVKIII